MNALLNTKDLMEWTGYNNLRDLTRFLNRMRIPYAQCGDSTIATTLSSVQTAFDAKEITDNAEIMRIEEVIKLVKLSKATVYLKEKRGEFPPKIKLGERAVGWKKHDVLQWLDGKHDWS